MEIRIKNAKELLKSKKYKAVEIAKLCGFVSSSHFFNAFKENTGFTTTEYLSLISN